MTHPVRQFRKDAKLTLSALATKTGLSKSYLSEIETFRRKAGRGAITAICNTTGLKPDVFFAGDESRGHDQ